MTQSHKDEISTRAITMVLAVVMAFVLIVLPWMTGAFDRSIWSKTETCPLVESRRVIKPMGYKAKYMCPTFGMQQYNRSLDGDAPKEIMCRSGESESRKIPRFVCERIR